ncbi:hypothetical protein I302_108441 [Kwoniella bestiolae CBS 10118]|uniref:Uncharacterized protein n=1 Tax=Kwoniella bestiolae CBS 10118 TaxID=1296100 RepID=A0A1B9FVQ3_9TREE|nr:hypothetical protein I302_07185 [Kwoniella bestiolae CBS 10118]OCF22840.1 hypothetical protein I302_07185 [Kwoniella bestiolae CBS 10118]
MSAPSRNALYVLRMVWRSHQPPLARRAASTATVTLARESDQTPTTTPNHASSSTSSTDKYRLYPSLDTPASDSTPIPPSFLESESDEYTAASLLLPAQDLHPEPIPWPTLFPHGNVVTPKSRFCDPIYRLVAQNRYQDALAIYKEILSHNRRVQTGLLGHSIRIQHRHEYLKPALQALEMGDHQSTLLWLSIYPNRPATSNHPVLKEIWQPVLDIVINEKGSFVEDPQFLQEFMVLVGQKGLLPTLLPPVLPHLTFAFPPETSLRILANAIKAYVSTTTSEVSETDRAKFQEEIVRPQVIRWWGSYLRKLIMGGWKEQASALAHAKPFGGDEHWDAITRKFIDEELLEPGRQKKAQTPQVYDTTNLITWMKSCLDDLPTPTELAKLIRALSHPLVVQDHPTSLESFKRRFTRPPLRNHRGRHTITVQSKLWIHADIINLQQDDEHHKAVEVFRKYFIWAGLPPLKEVYDQEPHRIGNERMKSQPTIQMITTIIPSIIYTLPRPKSKSVKSFYTAYMKHIYTFPPSLRPTPATHSRLLRELTHHSGAQIGLLSLRGLVDDDYQPGQEGYAAVLYALAGRRDTVQMWDLLDDAERAGMVGERTYRGMLAVLVKTGLAKEAERLFWRVREKLDREDAFEGLDLY